MWKEHYAEYKRRIGQLPRSPTEELDEARLTAWRELTDEFRQLLRDKYPDRATYQEELYAEVAALYEGLYAEVRTMQQQLKQRRANGSSTGASASSMSVSSAAAPSATTVPSAAAAPSAAAPIECMSRIKFVWWVAGEFLVEMKKKAPQHLQRMRETHTPPA